MINKKVSYKIPNIQSPPPHSVEAEQGVLGSMLLSPKETIPLVVEKINPNYFYIPAHQTVYNEIVTLWNENVVIDLVTFTQILRDKHLLDSVGGPEGVTRLYTFVPSSSNVEYYLDIMVDKYLLRQLIITSTENVRRAYTEQDSVESLLCEAQSSIQKIGEYPTEEKTFADLITDKFERMERGEPNADIILTHLKNLDEISPLRKGSMPLLTGERKSGKSITALTIFENICLGTKKPGIYFALEDPASAMIDRIFAGVSRIPEDRHHVSKLSPEEIGKAMEAADKLKQVNLMIYADAYDLPVIVARSKRAKLENPDLAVIVVDYAQLIRVPVVKGMNREAEVAQVSRGLRLLAMELNVPIILLSQLNEGGRSRESRALEQDATANWNIENMGEPGKRMINVRWQRHGESGRAFPVTFLGNIARVENYRPEN
jgi:replicative DNA helicase